MMPSRGSHLAKGLAPRAFQLQCKNLSSSRRISQISSRSGLSTPLHPRIWTITTPLIAGAIISRRNASTTPEAQHVPPPSSFPQDTSMAEASSAFPNMDTITLDNIELTPTDTSAVPETLGYLHDLGLNYGWGPTSVLQWSFEFFHISAGLPWWGSIAATAIALRLILAPFFIKSSDSVARMQAMKPLTEPVMDKMNAAKASGNQQEMSAAYQEFSAMNTRAGVSYRAQFTPMLIQGVFGYCGFKLLRAAAALPVPAFHTGGFLWLTDLTLPDPYLILPALMAGTIHVLIRMGGETGGANSMQPGLYTFMLWVMPTIIFFSCGWLPGAVVVWFAAGGALGVCQSLLLQRPAVREILGIAPLFKPKADDKASDLFGGLFNSKPSSSAASAASAASARSTASTTRGSAAQMRPTYQSPNFGNASASASDRVIDVVAKTRPASTYDTSAASSASHSSDDMIPPSGTPQNKDDQGGVFDKATNAWKNLSSSAQNAVGRKPLTPEQRAKQTKESERARARAYEKRAVEREQQRRRGGR